MTTRRLPFVIATFGLAAASALAALISACGEDGLGNEAPRDNGCIGSGCYTYDAIAPTGDGSSGGDDASDGAVVYINPLEGITDLTAKLVKGGFVFTEGPVWVNGHLYFSDTGQNTIFRLEDDAGATPVRSPSGGANGNAVDGAGRLYTCEGTRGRVTRTDTSLANPTPVADSFNGKAFDSPNDVIVRDDGNVYFTDPAYNPPPDGGYPQDKMAVYRVPTGAANAQSAQRLAFDFNKANGIALSPDGSTLYVVDNGAGKIMSATLKTDGTLDGTFTAFVDAVGGDGMCVDRGGNVFVAATAGVLVFDSAGAPLGTIKVTGTPSNVAFGGSDHKKLFVTARTNGGTADPATGVYAITLNNAGNP